jgi:membrane-associated phospholipid phosphatase
LISPKPITTTLHRTGAFLLYYFVMLLAGCCIIFLFPKRVTFFFINGHHHPIADSFFKYITFLGDGIFFGALVIYFLVRNKWYGLIGLWSFASSSLIAQLFKHFLFPGTLRPKSFLEDSPLLHFVEGVDVHSFGSFPSGHTASAFSIALWLSYISSNKYLSLCYIILAAGVAYSRVYLAQHFLEDVIMGSLIGVLSTLVVIIIMERRKKSDKA